MNHNRILRILNVLSISFGYQIHWFRVITRKFKLTLIGFVYFICLAVWYAICFHEHFTDSSILNVLSDLAPVLYICIRLHLLMGIKVMLFSVYETRLVTRALNSFAKALPLTSSWSWSELVAYIWLFSGILINISFAFYIMVQMEFMRPTLTQIMHFTAMALPHFTLASSVKLLNVTMWIARAELQKIRTEMNVIFSRDSFNGTILIGAVENNSVELPSIPKQPNYLALLQGRLSGLTGKLELLASATQIIVDVLQKQMVLLFAMNAICLLGATYSIVYYETRWFVLFNGPIGRSILAFNIGVFVFIAWDYFCLCVANFFLQREKSEFIEDNIKILKSNSTIEKSVKSLLKDIKGILKKKFLMRVYFHFPIAWHTFLLVNTLNGLAIAIIMVFYYFKDQIEEIQMRLEED